MYELMGGYSDCDNRSGRGVWVQRTLQEVIGSYRSRTEEFWPAAQKWSWTWRSKTTLSFSNWKIMLILMTSPNSDTVTNIDNYKLILPAKNRNVFWLLLPDRPSDCVILSPVFQVVFPNSAEHQFQLGLIKEGEQCVRDNWMKTLKENISLIPISV